MKPETVPSLITKILTETATDGERESFEAWLVADEANNRYYNQLLILWQRSKEAYNTMVYDEDAAKEKIFAKIQQRKSGIRAMKTRFWIKATASVLVLLSLGIVARYIFKPGDNTLLVYSSGNSIREIVLSDSSHIWLNENSILRSPKVFSNRQRNVSLEGEAYFEITRDEKKPFKVSAGNTIIKVLGTTFNVVTERGSGDVSIIVSSGKVAFSETHNRHSSTILTPNMKGIYTAMNHEIKTTLITDQNYLSWKTGVLTFYNNTLEEVCRVLSEYFKKDIRTSIEDSMLTLTGSFQNETLEDILKTIQLTLDIEVSVSDSEILLHK